MSYGTGTLLDLSKLSNDVPTKVTDTIIQCQPLLDQMLFAPCNNGDNNSTMLITDYPEGQTRSYNEGVQPEKAGGATVQDSTCMLATYSQIDVKILERNKNSAEWRFNQEKAFQRGIAHKAARMMFNSSLRDDPKSFNGLRARYNKSTGDMADVVMDAGGTADAAKGLQDIFIVNWDTSYIHAIYPEQGLAGLKRTDRGEQECYDKKGRRFRGVVTDYEWDLGLAIEDRRQCFRIANLDIEKINASITGGLDLVDMLIDAVESFPEQLGSHAAIYMSGKMRGMLRKQIRHTPNVNLEWGTVQGRECVTWDGIPVHKLPDSIFGTYAKPI